MTGVKKRESIECEVCQRSILKIHLKRHLKQHSQESSFVCKSCGLGFTHKCALSRHVITQQCKPLLHQREIAIDSILPEKSNASKGYFPPIRLFEDSGFYVQNEVSKGSSVSVALQEIRDVGLAIKDIPTKLGNTSKKRKVWKQHASEKKSKCSLCKLQFTHEIDLKNHNCKSGIAPVKAIVVQDKRSYQVETVKCSFCHKNVMKHMLKRHLKMHTEERPFKCDSCGCGFNFKGNLTKHNLRGCKVSVPVRVNQSKLLMEKGMQISRAKSDETCKLKKQSLPLNHCHICLKAVHSQFMNRHMKQHTEVRKHKCPLCSRRFKRKGAVKRHLMWSNCGSSDSQEGTDINQVSIEVSSENRKCTSDSAPGLAIVNHKKRCYSLGTLMCNFCHKNVKKNVIKRHLKMHTEERPFKCESCGCGFNFKTNLTKHKASDCDVSDPASKSKLLMEKSMQISLAKAVVEKCKVKRTRKPLKYCTICCRLIHGQFMNRHMKQHTEVRKHKCPQCSLGFKAKKALDKHLMSNICGSSELQKGSEQAIQISSEVSSENTERKYPQIELNKVTLPFSCSETNHVKNGNAYKANLTKHKISGCGDTVPVSGNQSTVLMGKNLQLSRAKADIEKCMVKGIRKPLKRCTICQRLVHNHIMKRHMKQHTEYREYRCPVCSLGFTREYRLKSHLMLTTCGSSNLQKGSGVMEVYREIRTVNKVCKRDSDPGPVIANQKKSYEMETLKCNFCHKDVKKNVIKRHLKMHVEERPYKCESCGCGFNFKTNLTKHKAGCEVPDSVKQPKPLMEKSMQISLAKAVVEKCKVKRKRLPLDRCSICHRFVHSQFMNRHLKQHTEIRKHACPLCSLGFTAKTALKRHLMSNMCGSSNLQRSSEVMQVSREINSKTKKFKCDSTPRSDTAHHKKNCYYRIGTLKCNFCHKNVKKNMIKRHLKLHVEERPFKCESCGCGFNFRANLSRHKASCCGATVPVKDNQSMLFMEKSMQISRAKAVIEKCKGKRARKPLTRCTICYRFVHSHFMSRHMKQHTEVRKHKCPLCSLGFKAKKALDRHLMLNICGSSDLQKSSEVRQVSRETSSEITVKKHIKLHKVTLPISSSKKNDVKIGDGCKIVKKDEPVPCQLCGALLSNNSNLRRHLRNNACKLFGEINLDQVSYKPEDRFLSTEMSFSKVFKAKDSKYVSKARNYATGKVIGSNTFASIKEICLVCRKGYSSKKKLEDHMEEHFYRRTYRCIVCSKHYHSLIMCRRHVRAQHAKMSELGSTCRLCNEKIDDNIQLENHMSFHWRDRVYKCMLCRKLILKQIWLKPHMESHAESNGQHFSPENTKIIFKKINSAMHQCTICRSLFSSAIELASHMETHIILDSSFRDSDDGVTNISSVDETTVFIPDHDEDDMERRLVSESETIPNGININHDPLGDSEFDSQCLQIRNEHNSLYTGNEPSFGKSNTTIHASNNDLVQNLEVIDGESQGFLNDSSSVVRSEESFSRGSIHSSNGTESRSTGYGIIREKISQFDGNKECQRTGESNEVVHSRSEEVTVYITENGTQETGYPEESFSESEIRNGENSDPLTRDNVVCDSSISGFTCSVCSEQFLTRGSLEAHMSIHLEGRCHICNVCGESFSQKNYLRKHMAEHGENQRFRCSVCWVDFLFDSDLANHMNTHVAKEMNYECKECGRKFIKKSGLVKHAFAHSNNQGSAFTCEFCQSIFFSKESLHQHMENHAKENGELTIEDNAENNELAMEGELHLLHLDNGGSESTENVATVHNDEELGGEEDAVYAVCPECPKICKTKAAYVLHMRVHSSQRKYKCRLCNKKFGSKLKLSRHLKKFTHGHKAFKENLDGGCKAVCKDGSDGIDKMQEPVLESLDENEGNDVNDTSSDTLQNFSNTCGSRYESSNEHLTHEKILSCLKNYTCNICQSKFITKSQLDGHVREHESSLDSHVKCSDVRDAEIPESEKFVCSICDKNCKKKSSLIVHEKFHVPCKTMGNQITLEPPGNRDGMELKEKHIDAIPTQVKKDDSLLFEPGKLACRYCGKTCKKTSSLVLHEKSHGPYKKYDCSICDLTFPTKIKLRKHERTHRYNVEIGERVQNADEKSILLGDDIKDIQDVGSENELCDKDMDGDLSRVSVEQKHNDTLSERPSVREKRERNVLIMKPGKYQCDICGKWCQTNGAFILHQKIHLSYRGYDCSVCGYAFTSRIKYREHQKLEHGEKVDKEVPSKEESVPSMTEKEKETDVVEDFCLKGIKEVPSKDKNEQSWRDKEKETDVVGCTNEEFGEKGIKEVESMENSAPSRSDKEEKTDVVGCTNEDVDVHSTNFLSKSDMKPWKYRCGICGKQCKTNGAFILHQKIHLSYRGYDCSVCGLAFRTRIKYREHQKYKHGENCCKEVPSKEKKSPSGRDKEKETDVVGYTDEDDEIDVVGDTNGDDEIDDIGDTNEDEEIDDVRDTNEDGEIDDVGDTNEDEEIDVDDCVNEDVDKKNRLSPLLSKNEVKISSNVDKADTGSNPGDIDLLDKVISISGKCFVCPICGKRCTRKNSLILHLKIHSSGMKQTCRNCNLTFESKAALCRHQKSDCVKNGKESSNNTKCEPTPCRLFDSDKEARDVHGIGETHKRLSSVSSDPEISWGSEKFSTDSHIQHESVLSGGDRKLSQIQTEGTSFISERQICYCVICQIEFKKLSGFARHMKMHGSLQYECSDCMKVFTTKVKLRKHKKYFCQKKVSKSSLPEENATNGISGSNDYCELTNEIVGESSLDEKEACDVCGKMCQKQGLGAHKRIHSLNRPLGCDSCDKRFSTHVALEMHMKFSHRETALVGNISQPIIKTQHSEPIERNAAGLPAEVISQGKFAKTDSQLYPCTFCGLKFKRANHLGSHFRVHLHSRPYPCGLCNRTFKSSGMLRYHEKCCKRNRPNIKMEDEVETSNLREAERSAINEKSVLGESKDSANLNQTSVSLDKLECTICGLRFQKHCGLQSHLRKHLDIRPYSCNVCHLNFTTPFNLKCHKKFKHKIGKKLTAKQDRLEMGDLWSSDENSAESSSPILNTKQKKNSSLSKNVNTCGVCHMKFEKSCDLATHAKTHSEKVLKKKIEQINLSTVNQFKCTICKNKYSDVGNFRLHMLSHEADDDSKEDEGIDHKDHLTVKKKDCKDISREGEASRIGTQEQNTEQSKLFSYMGLRRTNSGKMKIECKLCGKLLSSQKYFLIHIRGHQARGEVGEFGDLNNTLSVKCNICDRHFKTKWALDRHLHVHSKSTSNDSCDSVSDNDQDWSSLNGNNSQSIGENSLVSNGHLATSMDSEPEVNQKENTQHPSTCFDDTPGNKVALSPHIGKGSLDSRTCKYCCKVFYYKSRCMYHMARHSEKDYKCKFCNRSYYMRTEFLLHLKSHKNAATDPCRKKSKKITPKINTQYEDISPTKNENVATDAVRENSIKITSKFDMQYDISQIKSKYEAEKSQVVPKSPGKDINLSCKLCGKYLPTNKSFRKHQKIHLQQSKNRCFICVKKFKCWSSYNKHMRIHHPELLNKCSLCGEKCEGSCQNQVSDLDELSSLHGRRISDDGKLEEDCKVVLKKLESPEEPSSSGIDIQECKDDINPSEELKYYALDNTIVDKTKDKPFICSICGKAFRYMKYIKFHMEVHLEQKFECEICHKISRSAQRLKRHMLSHELGKRYSCFDCGTSFTQVSSLNKHCRVFHGSTPKEIKSLEGDIRNISKSSDDDGASDNGEHLDKSPVSELKDNKVGVDESPNACDDTGLNWNEEENSPENRAHVGKSRFECPICRKVKPSRSHLDSHMIRHSQEKPFKCPLCLKFFKRDYTVRKHIREIHSVDPNQFHTRNLTVSGRDITVELPYKCSVCDKGFIYDTSLKTHMMFHKKENSLFSGDCEEEVYECAVETNEDDGILSIEPVRLEDVNKCVKEEKEFFDDMAIDIKEELVDDIGEDYEDLLPDEFILNDFDLIEPSAVDDLNFTGEMNGVNESLDFSNFSDDCIFREESESNQNGIASWLEKEQGGLIIPGSIEGECSSNQ